MKEVPPDNAEITAKLEPQLGGRRFYDIPTTGETADPAEDRLTSSNVGARDDDRLLRYVADNVVGNDATFSGPFGRRKVVYADYTASGRSLSFIEKYIYQVGYWWEPLLRLRLTD